MGVVKGNQAGQVGPASVLALGDLRQQAEQDLAAARAEARRIVEQSRAEAEGLIALDLKRGHEEGFRQGLEEGRARGAEEGRKAANEEYRQRIEQLVETWTAALEAWEHDRGAMMQSAREDVLRLALAMGAKVCHRAIEAHPEAVVDQVAEALGLVLAPSRATVTVHPDDLPLVEGTLPQVLERIGQCPGVELRGDQAVGRGGCTVTTQSGRIDATIDRQLQRITEALLARDSSR